MCKMAIKQMKRTLTLLLSIVIALGVFVPAFAANITGIDENLPELDVKVAAPPGTYDKTRASQIIGTLNGQSLITTDFRKETASIEWIIMIDTSKSLSEEHFKAQKDAVLEVLKNLRETDRLVLYTFDDTVKQKLYGSESAAAAKKALDNIDCKGQDTAFYAAAVKLAELAEKCEASVCVPVIFSDGVETVKKGDRAKTITALKQSPVPIYGFYPNVANDSIKKSFNEVIKASGGSTKSFSKKNAASQLASFNSDDTYSIAFAATNSIKATKNALLEIDMGDGTKLTKEIVVSEWEGDTEPPKVISVITDDEKNYITVNFSEIVINCTDESIYEFTTADETIAPPVIKAINKTAADTVIIEVNSVDISGVKLKIKDYEDVAGNVGQEEEFSVTINEDVVKTLKTIGIGVGSVILLVIIILVVLMRIKRAKKNKEEALVPAAYKKGKKIEPKKEKPKKDKPEKVKLTAEEKAEQERLEKIKKKEEERLRAEEEKFKFFFEERFDPNKDDR